MIFFDSKNSEFNIKKPLDICLEFAKKAVDENLELGRYELGQGIYCTLAEVAPATTENDLFEAHRKYVDLHYIISGIQKMKVGFTEELTYHDFVEEKDYVKVSGKPHSVVNLTAGTGICLFPNDAHGLLITNDEEKIKKIFFKIPVALF